MPGTVRHGIEALICLFAVRAAGFLLAGAATAITVAVTAAAPIAAVPYVAVGAPSLIAAILLVFLPTRPSAAAHCEGN